MKVVIDVDRQELVKYINNKVDVPGVPEGMEGQIIETVADIVEGLLSEVEFEVGPVSINTQA